MNEQREFLASVESADVETLTALLRHLSSEQEHWLRVYFGDERFRRLRTLAVQADATRAAHRPLGNVVVLHGIMGSELTRIPPGKRGIPLWINLWQIARGEFSYCRLREDGRTAEHEIRPTGILKRYYGELLLSLAQHWNVRPFWFDWRKDVRFSASALESQICSWFSDDEPVHLVAHSMGGLVARTFMMSYRQRWVRMREAGSKLVMLGTPNHGSFAITQMLTGTEAMIRLIAKLDNRHCLRDIRSIAATFPGCYQMLPSPEVMPAMEALYDPDRWRHLPAVSARHLKQARMFQQWLSAQDDEDLEQMTYIAGCNQPTADGILDLESFQRASYNEVSNTALYHFTSEGDGTVPHRLGFLRAGRPMFRHTYYVAEEHGKLPVNSQVLHAVNDILRTGETQVLPTTSPTEPESPRAILSQQSPDEADLKAQWRRIHEPDLDEQGLSKLTHKGRSGGKPLLPNSVEYLVESILARSVNVEASALQTSSVTAEERKLEAILSRSFLYTGELDKQSRGQFANRAAAPTIEIGLLHGLIDACDYGGLHSTGGAVVDALAVGHYIGVRPQSAELALDIAISKEIMRQAGEDPPDELPERELLLTQYTDRGVLFGQLGQPFFVTDPRRREPEPERLVAVTGMGIAGQFGIPQLTVTARELCWALGQQGKRHLLTVLIGGGAGNLSTDDAILAWMRGIAQSLSGMLEPTGKRLVRVTFIESDPRRLHALDAAIKNVQAALRPDSVGSHGRLAIQYRPLDEQQREHLLEQAEAAQLQTLRQQWDRLSGTSDDAPTRIAVQMEGNSYSFGALTTNASIPQRTIEIDPRLVDVANDQLAAATELPDQLQQGRFLERLLIPRDFRGQLSTHAPLVIVLDRTTARLHWELFAQPDLVAGDSLSVHEQESISEESFLGTARGLTRQFRTIVAPLPEPPPPPQRLLRVLVVADPAPDARLPGAEREGMEVADLFESFNTLFAKQTKNRVEVHRLYGPSEATRENVLKKLMLEPWDVLHFAGHCFYDKDEPSASGWVFGMQDGVILTARELNRIDNVPKFVFSNACESGMTVDRFDRRDPRMAPSFAEAFFARGVANFVCTAWPVGDNAAWLFSRRLYNGLLGIEKPAAPEPMHLAMREARRAILPLGGRTWGAYQHYGNPHFRFFDAEAFRY